MKICRVPEREILLDGYHKAFCLGAGPCDLCNERNKETCTNPTKAHPSMKACGKDVFVTIRADGSQMEWPKDKSCDKNYFGLV